MVSAICLGLLCVMLGLGWLWGDWFGFGGACLRVGCAFCCRLVAGVLFDLFACIVYWLHMGAFWLTDFCGLLLCVVWFAVAE